MEDNKDARGQPMEEESEPQKEEQDKEPVDDGGPPATREDNKDAQPMHMEDGSENQTEREDNQEQKPVDDGESNQKGQEQKPVNGGGTHEDNRDAQPMEEESENQKEGQDNQDQKPVGGGRSPSSHEASVSESLAAQGQLPVEDKGKDKDDSSGAATTESTAATASGSGDCATTDSTHSSTLGDHATADSTHSSTHATADSIPRDHVTAHVFNESWSKLTKDVIIDKVKGVIYGQAIGDAFGLATEFLSRKAARKYYKHGPSGYSDIINDFHRSRWDKGDWTDDTDQMLLILQMINKKQGQVDKVDFANRLYNWMRFGYKELGDVGGMGIGMTVHRTLTHPDFLKDPHKSAKEVWELSGRYLAANGAIMRTSILGILNFNDIPKVVANTAEICKVTHADPRCAASCITVTTAIAMILKGDYDLTEKDGIKHLVEAALKGGEKVLEHKDQKKEMNTHMNSSLDGLKLDESQSIGYTFKALGAGFYGLRNSRKKGFREIILEVIMEAGDADSNGAVCGALMGCAVGFKALPEDLLQFPHRIWLDKQVDKFLTTIGLKD